MGNPWEQMESMQVAHLSGYMEALLEKHSQWFKGSALPRVVVPRVAVRLW